MTIIDRFRAFFGRLRKAVMLIPTWVSGQPQYSDVSILSYIANYYEKDDVAYACIKEIARTASEAQLKVYKKDKEGQMEHLPDHPLQELLDSPNPKKSQYELHEGILTDLNVSGEAFIYLEPSGARRIVGLWRLRPERITIIPGDMGEVVGYRYAVGDTEQTFGPEDVIHIPFFHPADDYRGLSPMKVASRLLDINTDLTDYIKKFFEQGAMIPGFLKYLAGRLSAAEKRKARKEFTDIYGGVDEWPAPPILDVDVDFVKTGLDYTQMEFGELRSNIEVGICRIFGVPPILLPTRAGLDRATYTNYPEARTSFWQETLSPLYRRIQDKWQMGLVPRFGNDLILQFDFSKVKALEEDLLEPKKVAIQAFAASGITRNMLLQAFGEDPIGPPGDVFLQPMMVLEVPMGGTGEKAFQIISPDYKRLPAGRVTFPEEGLKRYAYMRDVTARAWQGPFKDGAQRVFTREKKEVLALLRKFGKKAKQGTPYKDLLTQALTFLAMNRTGWQEEFLPLFAGLLAAQGENISAGFGISFDLASETTLAWLDVYSAKFAEGITGVTGKKVEDVIRLGQQEGWSVPNMRKALTDEFDQFDKIRAEAIARTETIKSSNAGSIEAYRQAGIMRKEWLAVMDGRTCAFCQQMHAEYGPGTGGVSLSEVYWNEGGEMIVGEQALSFNYESIQHPPLHTNCRCDILPVIEEV